MMRKTKNMITGIRGVSIKSPKIPPMIGEIEINAINFENLTAYSFVAFFTDALILIGTSIFLLIAVINA